MNRICRLLTCMLASLVLGVASAHAQTGYPDRSVKMIGPIGPGGSYIGPGGSSGRGGSNAARAYNCGVSAPAVARID